MKSAEDYGYKVGELFVIHDNSTAKRVSVGTVIELGKDDGTEHPFFYQHTNKTSPVGSSGYDLCIGLGYITPLSIPPEEVDQYIAEVKLKELIGAV